MSARAGMLVADDVVLRAHLLAAAVGVEALDGEGLRLVDLQAEEARSPRCGTPCRRAARAEVPPVAPTEGVQAVVVLAERRGPDPLVPVQAGGDGLGLGAAAGAAEVAAEERVASR